MNRSAYDLIAYVKTELSHRPHIKRPERKLRLPKWPCRKHRRPLPKS